MKLWPYRFVSSTKKVVGGATWHLMSIVSHKFKISLLQDQNKANASRLWQHHEAATPNSNNDDNHVVRSGNYFLASQSRKHLYVKSTMTTELLVEMVHESKWAYGAHPTCIIPLFITSRGSSDLIAPEVWQKDYNWRWSLRFYWNFFGGTSIPLVRNTISLSGCFLGGVIFQRCVSVCFSKSIKTGI